MPAVFARSLAEPHSGQCFGQHRFDPNFFHVTLSLTLMCIKMLNLFGFIASIGKYFNREVILKMLVFIMMLLRMFREHEKIAGMILSSCDVCF